MTVPQLRVIPGVPCRAGGAGGCARQPGSNRDGPIIATSGSGSACATRATCSSRRRPPRPVTAKCSSPGTARPGCWSAPLPNDAGQSPAAYQDYIARESYAGYRIDYRRLAGNWFVLSGEGNGKTFYEKVMFSCAGRLINSFAMVYPTDQRDTFDRVVEGMEKSFRPARECGDRAAAPPPQISAAASQRGRRPERKAPKGSTLGHGGSHRAAEGTRRHRRHAAVEPSL